MMGVTFYKALVGKKMIDEKTEKHLKEYGRKIRCPKCKSTDWSPVHPFDYVKQCNKCKEQFSDHPHN